MSYSELLTQIAQHSDNQVVITSLFTLPDLSIKYALADNLHLTSAQRAKLSKNAPVDLAQRLAASAVGDEAIAKVLSDRRNTVKTELFRAGIKGASDPYIATLIAELSKENLQSSQSNLNHWLSSKNPPSRALTRQLASKVHVSVQLKLLADTTLYTSAEVLNILTSLKIPAYQSIAPVLDIYPELLPDLLEAMRGNLPHAIDKGVLFSALATCRHIFGQETFIEITRYCSKLRKPLAIRMLMALTENPNLAPETFRVVTRALSNFHQPTATALNKKLADRLKHQGPSYVTQDWARVLTAPTGQLPFEKAKIVAFANKSYYWNYPTLQDALLSLTSKTGHSKRSIDELTPLAALIITPPTTTLPQQTPAYALDYQTFATRVLPQLLPYGPCAIEIFLNLSLAWQSNVQELLDTTLASVS